MHHKLLEHTTLAWVVVFVKIGMEGFKAIIDIRLCATQEPRVLA